MTQADVDYAEALYIARRSDDAITSSLVYRGLSREEACELLELVKQGTPPAISPQSRGRPFSANANCVQAPVAPAASGKSQSNASLLVRCVSCGLQFSTVLLWLAACTLGFTPGGCAKVQLDRMSHGVKICSASDCSRDAVGSLPYTLDVANARDAPLERAAVEPSHRGDSAARAARRLMQHAKRAIGVGYGHEGQPFGQ